MPVSCPKANAEKMTAPKANARQVNRAAMMGFIVLSATMTAAALIELIWGVAAERRPLEDVARPLTFIK